MMDNSDMFLTYLPDFYSQMFNFDPDKLCSKISVSGDKGGLKELINMLGVFINLLYTNTLPNNHY